MKEHYIYFSKHFNLVQGRWGGKREEGEYGLTDGGALGIIQSLPTRDTTTLPDQAKTAWVIAMSKAPSWLINLVRDARGEDNGIFD